jgi:hypothetical protein
MRFLAVLLLWASVCQAQLVNIPIPGAPGLYITVSANPTPLAEIKNNPLAVNVTMGDDANRGVPLGFSFPYFGQTFTQSWMHSNGVVSFQQPGITGNFCCSGENLTQTTTSQYNYSIMPMWTDLIAPSNNNHFYLQGNNEITYGWYGVNEYGTQNANSFELKLNSAGLVDVRLQGAMISMGRPVTSGMTGNLAQGEYFQFYHGSGWNAATGMSWAALDGTGGGNVCFSNPLSSPSCPGYAAAYYTQQCTISALYDPTCPGYVQANFTYQCSLNPLYSQLCPGYAQAYFNQQCSLNGLYDRTCPNYATTYATQQLLTKEQESTHPTTQSPQQIQQIVTTSNTLEQGAGPSASPANVTSAVPLVQQPPPPQSPSPGNPVAAVGPQQSGPPPGAALGQQQPPQQPTTRAQQIQQARAEAAKKDNAAKGGENMKEAKGAKSLEQQVAVQGAIVAAMGFSSGFDVYTTLILKDTPFYKSFEIYKGKENVDNTRVLRGLYGPSENRHQQLIDQQYK